MLLEMLVSTPFAGIDIRMTGLEQICSELLYQIKWQDPELICFIFNETFKYNPYLLSLSSYRYQHDFFFYGTKFLSHGLQW